MVPAKWRFRRSCGECRIRRFRDQDWGWARDSHPTSILVEDLDESMVICAQSISQRVTSIS